MLKGGFIWCCAAMACPGLLAWAVAPSFAAETKARPIEFNRDIRPILSDNCFACHGPDKNKRKAGLRLDTPEGAFAPIQGRLPLAAGNPAKSEVFRRITTTDKDDLMPPEESGHHLSAAQIALIKRWIEQGARYEAHWAFIPIKKHATPKVQRAKWVRTPIDAFILQRLEHEGIEPAAEADRRTLIRRLSFDLTGLPPTPREVDAFAADASADAYEKLVDRLLASPHYGERMAIWWLDLVRYADTVGYHGDQDISVWAFRDYVIKAFNSNMPFDRFALEQLAGDLLPGATRDQQVASGYNRLGMMSAEGGVQDKEYLAKYAAERVRNIGGAFLGMTTGCAECHDHKFDPFTAHDFYAMEAFFADLTERGLYGGANATGDWGPRLILTTPETDRQLAKIDQQINGEIAALIADRPSFWADVVAWIPLVKQGKKKVKLPGGLSQIVNYGDPGKLQEQLDDNTRIDLIDFYINQQAKEKLGEHGRKLQDLKRTRQAVLDGVPVTLVAQARPEPRVIRFLARGNWMDDSGEIMQPATPGFLPKLQQASGGSGARLTRADLARWLTGEENPLVSRALANRFWAMFLGAGISKRLDDLGAQGDWPEHPELLDWLAGYLIDHRWDIKKTIRLIVTSSVYRQSSSAATQVVERDPDNRLCARQWRFRLPAELVRDNALAVSGLLDPAIGGRSVRPYQPPGYYAQLNFPKREYAEDTGSNLWRRSLYTHWQRTFLHPMMRNFDAPTREECTADRPRSNTPLQALTLLNDPEFVEAARALAVRIVTEQPAAADEARLDQLMKRVLGRVPSAAERKLLGELLQKHRAEYRKETEDAKQLLSVGKSPLPAGIDPGETAAWASVCRVVLNLHETVTRD